VQRHLPGRIAHLGPKVFAVQVNQLLAGQPPQPQEERHTRVGGVLGKALHEDEKGFLEHVFGIEAALESAVPAEVDHPPEPFAVAREQLGQGLPIAGTSLAKDVIGTAWIAGHDPSHTNRTGRAPHQPAGKIMFSLVSYRGKRNENPSVTMGGPYFPFFYRTNPTLRLPQAREGG